MAKFKCDNGIVYNVPNKSCLKCSKCTDIFWDYTNGPYLAVCEEHRDTDLGWDGKCGYFIKE